MDPTMTRLIATHEVAERIERGEREREARRRRRVMQRPGAPSRTTPAEPTALTPICRSSDASTAESC